MRLKRDEAEAISSTRRESHTSSSNTSDADAADADAEDADEPVRRGWGGDNDFLMATT
jgi:hypothetical protein